MELKWVFLQSSSFSNQFAHYFFWLFQLHVDTGHHAEAQSQEKKEEDFFAEQEKFPEFNQTQSNGSFAPKVCLILYSSFYNPFLTIHCN